MQNSFSHPYQDMEDAPKDGTVIIHETVEITKSAVAVAWDEQRQSWVAQYGVDAGDEDTIFIHRWKPV